MRWQKVVLILGVTFAAGLLVMFVGCGDDKSTDSTVDYNNPEYLAVWQEVDCFVDSTMVFFRHGLGNIYGLPTDTTVDPCMYGPGPPDYDSTRDTASATYADGWHVVYFSIYRDAYHKIVRDSIQFIKDGEPQQSSAGLEGLLYKHFWKYDVTDTTVTHKSHIGDADYSVAGLDNDQTTIMGTDHVQIHSKYVSADSTVWRDISLEATLTDVLVSKTGSGWAQGCPNAGSIAATSEMVYKKDSAAPDTTNWTVTLSFNDGTMYSTVTRGSASWPRSTEVCTPPR